MGDTRFNERAWLAWLVKVRVIVVSFLLAIELLIVNLTPSNVPTRLFITIILVTAKADSRDVVAGLEAGADEYLTKPVDQLALVARVKSVLRLKELHDCVAAQAADLAAWNRNLERRVADQSRCAGRQV